jgi:hypothetical protein
MCLYNGQQSAYCAVWTVFLYINYVLQVALIVLCLAISFLQCTITTFIRRTNGKIWEPSNKAVLFRILGSNGQKSSSPLPARITCQSVPLQCATLTLPVRCADRNGLPPSRRPRAIWYRGRYGLDNLGFDFRQGEEVLMFSKNPRPAVRHTQPPAHWKPVFFFFFAGSKATWVWSKALTFV